MAALANHMNHLRRIEMQHLLFLSLFLMLHPCCPLTPPEKHIFILAGQSNMAGRGGVVENGTRWDGVVPPECQPNPRILRLNARLRWVEAREPLHADIDTKTCGVGPGMPFASAVLSHDMPFAGTVIGGKRGEVVVVGLVPCAIGGTAIREWEKGSRLYGNMVMRVSESLKGGGNIKGLLWYQGESDTVSKADADSYKDNMEKFIGDIRADLGFPNLPVFQVALASGEGPFIEIVREAQLGINLTNVYCVDAKGLLLKDDHLHLTTDSEVKLGKMLADEYFKHFTA